MSIVIRLLKIDESALANDFFNAIYKTNRSLRDFEWEFKNGPSGPAIYVVAIDNDIIDRVKVVGIQCAIPLSLTNIKGRQILTAKSEDTLVDPSYRGQKIFERMYDLLFEECKKAGIKYIWGFTPATKAFERIGFEIPFQAHQALMVFNPFRAYVYLTRLNDQNKPIDRLKIAGLTLISWLASFKARFTTSKSIAIKRVSFAPKGPTLIDILKGSDLHFLDMTSSYLDWRLTRNPFNNTYENYQAFQGSKLVADVITNYRNPNPGYIEQIIFDASISAADRQKIIYMVIKQLRTKVDLIRALCFDTNPELSAQGMLLQQCGFILLKRGGHFVWKSLNGDGLNPSSIFLSRLFTQGNQ